MKKLLRNKNLLAIVCIIVIVVLVLVFGKSSPRSNDGSGVDVNYTPVPRQPLGTSLETSDIHDDLKQKLEFPANSFKL